MNELRTLFLFSNNPDISHPDVVLSFSVFISEAPSHVPEFLSGFLQSNYFKDNSHKGPLYSSLATFSRKRAPSISARSSSVIFMIGARHQEDRSRSTIFSTAGSTLSPHIIRCALFDPSLTSVRTIPTSLGPIISRHSLMTERPAQYWRRTALAILLWIRLFWTSSMLEEKRYDQIECCLNSLWMWL